MKRILWLSAAMVAIGALMVFAGGASAKTGKAGGTLNVDLMSDVDFTDPALDYFQPGWAIEYATCLKLMKIGRAHV